MSTDIRDMLKSHLILIAKKPDKELDLFVFPYSGQERAFSSQPSPTEVEKPPGLTNLEEGRLLCIRSPQSNQNTVCLKTQHGLLLVLKRRFQICFLCEGGVHMEGGIWTGLGDRLRGAPSSVTLEPASL